MPSNLRDLESIRTDAELKTTQQVLRMRWWSISELLRSSDCISRKEAPCRASKPLLLSSRLSLLLSLSSSILMRHSAIPPTHIRAWFIFPAPASAPRDLYVYGHYWRWVIHFSFSFLLHLPLLSFGRARGCGEEYQWPFFFSTLWSQLFISSLSPALRKVKIKGFFPLIFWFCKGVLAFPSRNSLCIINNIFSSGDVSWSCWFEMFAPSFNKSSRRHRATSINREPRSRHTKPRVSFQS